jgi:hypothetical protein
MLSATPPEHDLGSLSRVARTNTSTRMPRTAFVLSLLSVIGVAVSGGVVLMLVTLSFSFLYGSIAVFGMLIVVSVSFLLALLGLGGARSWRQAGGRGRLSVLTIVLASITIVGFALAILLIVLGVIVFVVALSKI